MLFLISHFFTLSNTVYLNQYAIFYFEYLIMHHLLFKLTVWNTHHVSSTIPGGEDAEINKAICNLWECRALQD